MMKSFFKKLAFVMALAMVFTTAAPAAKSALAATEFTYAYQNASNRFQQAGLQVVSDRNEHYLDIPVNVKYGYDVLPSKLKIFAFAGPVFSFGLSSVTSASADNSIVEPSIKLPPAINKLQSYPGTVSGIGVK